MTTVSFIEAWGRRAAATVYLAALACGVAGAGVLATPAPAQPVLVDRLVAIVGEQALTWRDVEAARLLGSVPAGGTPADGVERLVTRELMHIEVERLAVAAPIPAAVDERLERARQRAGGPDAVRARASSRSASPRGTPVSGWPTTCAWTCTWTSASRRRRSPPTSRSPRPPPGTACGSPPPDQLREARRRLVQARRTALVADWLAGIRERTSVQIAGDAVTPPAAARRLPAFGHGDPAGGWRGGRQASGAAAAAGGVRGRTRLVAPLLAGHRRARVRIALLSLVAIAVVRPAWSPAVLIGLVPLLPVWPSLVPGVPPRRGTSRRGHAGHSLDRASRCSASAARATAWRRVGPASSASPRCRCSWPSRPSHGEEPTSQHVGRLLRAQVPSYIFESDHLLESGAMPTWTVLVDGLACALIVGWAATRAHPRADAACGRGGGDPDGAVRPVAGTNGARPADGVARVRRRHPPHQRDIHRPERPGGVLCAGRSRRWRDWRCDRRDGGARHGAPAPASCSWRW